MKTWYTKEFADLTSVSTRTLHHYDHIDLLKPSIRQPNGYRLYSEGDLLKLQQIIALKFFGFKLLEIQKMLDKKEDVLQHFSVQSQLMQEKANAFLEASKILSAIVSECDSSGSISWEKIIEMIEVFQMTKALEENWVSDVLNSEELKEYAQFKKNLETRSSQAQKDAFHSDWANLVKEVSDHLDTDPKSVVGRQLGKRCMDMVNKLYGKEHAALRRKIWEKGFKENKMDDEHGLTPEIVAWLDRAIDAHYRHEIYSLLEKVTSEPSKDHLAQWKSLMDEMCGNDDASRKELFDEAMSDPKISRVAKAWLLEQGTR